MIEKIKGMDIYYEVCGEGRPILFLHGFPIDHMCMKECMEPLFSRREGYKRIYLDLPGMGKSGSSDEIRNADDMIDVVHRLLNFLVPGQSCLVGGYSYGGYLARGLVYKYSNEFDGLLLICPVAIPDKRLRTLPEPVVLERDASFLGTLSPSEAREFDGMAVIQNERIYRRCREEITLALQRSDREFVSRYLREGYSFSFPLDGAGTQEARSYDKPVLFLMGLQDSVVGYKDTWPLLDNYPRASFVLLDRAGHNLQIEQEEMLAIHVNDWLNRIK